MDKSNKRATNTIVLMQGQLTYVPVVLTPLIAKAIPELQNGDNCLICEDSQDFAKACLSLIENKELHKKIRTKGYEMVVKHYSWHEKLKGYEIIN